MAEQRRCLYDPNLGVSPNQKRLGEETEVMIAIASEGGRGLWVPEASVEHIIPARRLSLDYIRTYQRAAGETWAYLNLDGKQPNFMGPYFPPGVRSLMGAPFRAWRMTFMHGFRYVAMRLLAPSEKWMEELLRYEYALGALIFYIKSWKRARHRVTQYDSGANIHPSDSPSIERKRLGTARD